MMIIKKILSIALVLSIGTLATFGQQKQKEIKIGDKLPDIVVRGVINQSSDKISLKDLYQDGLLIIDFWGTYCVPCIAEMKFLDSLKGKHPNKFNVLMVSPEKAEVVTRFLTKPRNQNIRTSNLILANNDTLLHQLFPHRSVPHNIWIDRNGIVKAITQGDQVNEENILNFETYNNISRLRTKKDNMTFDALKPFRLADTIFTYRSIISPFIDGISGGATHKSYVGGKTIRSFQYNASILQMYWSAYSLFSPHIKYNLIEVHTNDSLRLFFPSQVSRALFKSSKYKDYNDWADRNAYCYELTLPQAIPDSTFRNYMFNDLHRQFLDISAKIEKRNIMCTMVTKINGEKLKKCVSKNNLQPSIFLSNNKLIVRNSKINDLLHYLFRLYPEKQLFTPFVKKLNDLDDICFDVDLDFSKENSDQGISIDMVLRELEKYGFRFEKRIMPYPILIINL